MTMRIAVCRMYWWFAEIQRGDFFGTDSSWERPRYIRSCFKDAWYSHGETGTLAGKPVVEIFRMQIVNGGYDSNRCQYLPHWESVDDSVAARAIWERIRHDERRGNSVS